MNKKMILGFAFVFMLVVSINLVSADFFYSPMNFELNSPSFHTINITLNGTINTTLPIDFTLVSGNLSGVNNVYVVVKSPNVSDEGLYVGDIFLNGSHYDNLYFVAINDSKIVDNKIELGHGDFNYIDSDQEIGEDNNLIFSLVRVWGIGSDILDEPATDVHFNCTYPMLLPRTVDSKYSTEYTSSKLVANGELMRLEGISLFRVFVLSQEFDGDIGDNYEVFCSNLTYSFSHTNVIAKIPSINLSVHSNNPLVIMMQNNSGYITYIIKNNDSYNLRNVEFVWKSGSNTQREQLDTLDAGEIVKYDVYTSIDDGNISLEANFIPEWMFHSRSPTILTQTSFDVFDTNSITTLVDWFKVDSTTFEKVVQYENLNSTIDIVSIPIYNSMGLSIDDILTATCKHNGSSSEASVSIRDDAIYLSCERLFYPGQNTTFDFQINSDTDDLNYIRLALGDEVCFDNLNASDYYINQSILTPVFLETTSSSYQIQTLQPPLSGNTYQVVYYFFDNGVLLSSVTKEITGVDTHIISFKNNDLDPLTGEVQYDVYSKVRMLNSDGLWQCFNDTYLGKVTVSALSNHPRASGPYDVIVSNVYDKYSNDEKITANVIIKNTGDVPDKDTVLTYWLVAPDGQVYGETKEQFLEMPVGVTVLRKSITLPQGASPGDWKFMARYDTVVQPTIEVQDSFSVVTGYSVFNKISDRWENYINEKSRSLWMLFIIVLIVLALIIVIFSQRLRRRR